MLERPSQMWKTLPADRRLAAAEAFWRDDQDDSRLQHVEAVVAIAKRLKFRPKSVQALPIDRRARQLAQISDVSDAIATRALIAYHFTEKRDLMGAFLDALGIAHDRGLIDQDDVAPPDRDKLLAAANAVRAAFPKDDVDLYLRTLATLDGDTWAGLNSVLERLRGV